MRISEINKKGFSLIELIIVMIIIGILSSLAAPMMQTFKARAIACEAMNAIDAINRDLQQYYVEYGVPFGAGLPAPSYYDQLDGQYFHHDNYQVALNTETSVTMIWCTFYRDFGGPKVNDAVSTLDNPSGYGRLYFFCNTKKFKQANWSKTGIKQYNFDGDPN